MKTCLKKNKIMAATAWAVCLAGLLNAVPARSQQALDAALERAAFLAETGDEDAAPKTLYLFLGRARRCEKTDPASSAALYSLAAQALWEYATGTNFDDGKMDKEDVTDSLVTWTEKAVKKSGDDMRIWRRALLLMQQIKQDFPETACLKRIERISAKAQAKVSADFSGDFAWDGLPDLRYTGQIYREMGFPAPEKDYSRDRIKPGSLKGADTCCKTALQAARQMAVMHDSGKNWRTLWPVLRCYAFTEGGFSEVRTGIKPEYNLTLEVCNILSRIPYTELSALDDWTYVMRPAFNFMGERIRDDYRRIFWEDPLPDTSAMVPPQDKITLWFLCEKWKDLRPQLRAHKEMNAYGRMITRAGLKPGLKPDPIPAPKPEKND